MHIYVNIYRLETDFFSLSIMRGPILSTEFASIEFIDILYFHIFIYEYINIYL